MRPPGGPETNKVTFTGSLCHGCYYICSEQRCVIIPELLPSKIQGGWATRQMLLCKQSTWRQFMTWQKEERKGQDGAPRNDVLGILFAPTYFYKNHIAGLGFRTVSMKRYHASEDSGVASLPHLPQLSQRSSCWARHSRGYWHRATYVMQTCAVGECAKFKKYSIQCSFFIP
jgi:hypothetical protein